MEVQFRMDYAFLQSQQTSTYATAKPAQNHKSDRSALSISNKQSSRLEIYSVSGSLQVTDQTDGSLFTRYRSLVAMARGQAAFLSTQANGSVGSDSGASLNLAALTEKMPQDIEGLAEYWNKSNTAERIFTIALLGFEPGDDRDAAVERAISMVTQAYNDVQSMMGGFLPSLVLDTKAAVLNALEQFKAGTPIDEIGFA